jgi:ATP-dependent DNA helicase RecG
MDEITDFLLQLDATISTNKFVEMESDTIELKPCPSSTQDWSERYRSINAFLNTRGGCLILGIKEVGQGLSRKYEVSGYDATAENKLKEVTSVFQDAERRPIDLTEYLPPPEIRQFMGARIAIQRVDAMPAVKRFVFYKDAAYKRILTGDHRIKQEEFERQQEYLEETAQAKELEILKGHGIESIDLDKLNEYIYELNRLQKIENIKPTLADAKSFLARKNFLINDTLTVLGALVCGAYPGDLLGFKSHVHGYVKSSSQSLALAQDKQDMIDNVLPLLIQSNNFVLRNIQAGISTQLGGSVTAQYPEAVLRETINNALAHRDYSINKQIVISISPGESIEVSNPGKFKDQLLITLPQGKNNEPPLLRVVPETKPRNPRLADVLRVYRKWEGRGIGMSTLVSLCLENKLDLPYFKFKSDEVMLTLQPGKLLDQRMIDLFESRDSYIAKKLGSLEELSDEKKAVLAYLIKSEWANFEGKYCVLLTTDNNHADAIKILLSSGLLMRDERSPELYPIYRVDRNLTEDNFEAELRAIFGTALDELPLLWRRVLTVAYRYNNFSSRRAISAKQAGLSLWTSEKREESNIRAFDHFNRNVRYVFNELEKRGFLERDTTSARKGYVLTSSLKGSQKPLF